MKYESIAALLRAAADSIEMQEKAGIVPKCKVYNCQPDVMDNLMFINSGYDYEFPIAVVEGKPVFVGDELYDTKGNQRTVKSHWVKSHWQVLIDGKWSWNPPKPKTVMVELTVEDATRFVVGDDGLTTSDRLTAACKKALEAL